MEACAFNNLLSYYTEDDVSTKVQRKTLLRLSFVNARKSRSSHSQMFLKIGVLRFHKSHRKTPALESHFNKFKNLKRDSNAGVFL